MDTSTDIAQQLQQRRLALFIGADLPRDVTGLPSRADLARELARRKGLTGQDGILPHSLAEVAQRVSQAGNRWEFTDLVRTALDTTGRWPQPFHQRIATLVMERRVDTIITTAYDNLLELAIQQAGFGFNRVVRGSDVSFVNPDRPTLIKLYGDAGQPDTLVVTDRDHSDLWRDRDREPLLDEVRRALRLNTVLFIGYNLADPDFRFLFDQVAGSRFARTAYAVWPGLPEADVRMWRDRGIVILDTDPLGILIGNVAELALPGVRDEIVPEPGEVESLCGQAATTPVSPPPTRSGSVNYERGLQVLKARLEQTNRYDELNVLEARLRENLSGERLYGASEQSRRERAQVIDVLNRLALDVLGTSFNDLSRE